MRVLFLLATAFAAAVTPVQEAVIMMEDLQTKIASEGEAEAKTYEKFACFCKDETKARTDAIDDAVALLRKTQSQLTTANTLEDETLGKISGTEGRIGAEQKALDDENADWAIKVDTYNKDLADLKDGIENLENALQVLKASRRPTLLQMQTAVNYAVSVLARVHGPDYAPTQDYDFHSEGIIETLKQLNKKMRNGKNDLEKTHIQNTGAHDKTAQAHTDTITMENRNLRDQKRLLAETQAEISSKNNLVSITQAKLMDDQDYLKGLTEKCTLKKKIFDQRGYTRMEENAAITTAITIVKASVLSADESVRANKSDKKDRAFERSRPDKNFVQEETEDDDEEEMVADEDMSADEELESFLQTGAFMKTRSPRERASELLVEAARKQSNKQLAAIATRVGADPLARVKQLIQNLIEKLLADTSDEENHQGWCDEELTKTKQKRDQQWEILSENRAAALDSDAQRQNLEAEMTKLNSECSEIRDAHKTARTIRLEEQSENERAIDDATKGKAAIEKATEVLKKFYSANAKNETPTFVQETDEQPADLDYTVDEGSQGSQDTAVGIFGMMEVILSDFDRTIKETNEEEANEHQEFIELSRALSNSHSSKHTTIDQLEADLTETVANERDQIAAFKQAVKLFNDQLNEWESLRSACVTKGVSYSDRKAARENEIESLKQALQILTDNEE